ncbi:MAG: hypothetical protein ACFFE8_04495 [Candidatus Heimdallarchaeota archaeon]
MIFALGSPVNARCRPWTFDWAIKPDALMISAIDFLSSPRLFETVKKKGIREYLGWDGKIICDSGAFSALNRKKKINLDIERLKEIYLELNAQDSSIFKITLDFPDDKIVSNYRKLFSLGIHPVVPHDRLELIDEINQEFGAPKWFFIGRLVPLMRGGGNQRRRLFSALLRFRKSVEPYSRVKFWALGVGAPSIIREIPKYVDGCDSTRWRITGSNMILLPQGGERGVGNITKWRGTRHRIGNGSEKEVVIQILKQLDEKSAGLESLDGRLQPDRLPKPVVSDSEINLPTIGNILEKLRGSPNTMAVIDLERLFRSSGDLRLIFNYWAALSFKIAKS